MDKKYKETYKAYLRLLRGNCLYNLDFQSNPDYTMDNGYLVGYNPKDNIFLFQIETHGWAKMGLDTLTAEGYIVAKSIKMPPRNLWNVGITNDVIREFFKQQLQQLSLWPLLVKY